MRQRRLRTTDLKYSARWSWAGEQLVIVTCLLRNKEPNEESIDNDLQY